MPEIKDATHAKQLLARKLLLVSGHQTIVSEVERFNKPDILSLTRSDMIIEYEIKVARSDLMGELNSVKKCRNLQLDNANARQMELGGSIIDIEQEKHGKCSKLAKHQTYLIPEAPERDAFGYYTAKYRPNQFYFAVTADLVELALEACKGTPYGVLDLNAIDGSSSIKKKAWWIHRDEPTRSDIQHMAHVLSFSLWT